MIVILNSDEAKALSQFLIEHHDPDTPPTCGTSTLMNKVHTDICDALKRLYDEHTCLNTHPPEGEYFVEIPMVVELLYGLLENIAQHVNLYAIVDIMYINHNGTIAVHLAEHPNTRL